MKDWNVCDREFTNREVGQPLEIFENIFTQYQQKYSIKQTYFLEYELYFK